MTTTGYKNVILSVDIKMQSQPQDTHDVIITCGPECDFVDAAPPYKRASFTFTNGDWNVPQPLRCKVNRPGACHLPWESSTGYYADIDGKRKKVTGEIDLNILDYPIGQFTGSIAGCRNQVTSEMVDGSGDFQIIHVAVTPSETFSITKSYVSGGNIIHDLSFGWKLTDPNGAITQGITTSTKSFSCGSLLGPYKVEIFELAQLMSPPSTLQINNWAYSASTGATNTAANIKQPGIIKTSSEVRHYTIVPTTDHIDVTVVTDKHIMGTLSVGSLHALSGPSTIFSATQEILNVGGPLTGALATYTASGTLLLNGEDISGGSSSWSGSLQMQSP